MAVQQEKFDARQQAAQQPSDKLYMENTLLRVFGVLFCHDPKRARTRSGRIEVNRGIKEKNIAVRLDDEYRQPGPFAHKIAMAVIKKQSNYGRPIQKEISFSQRELLRLTGRKTLGGKDSDELVLALKQIRYTHVIAHFKRADRFIEHDFSIFNEVLIERRESPRDPVVACSVVLADPIVNSLQDEHFTCLNHLLMQQLGTIGQALYMRLFFHFANLYDGHHKKRLAFPKRYDDICMEWLGGLTIQKHQSLIERDQLGPHLTQLVHIGMLASYSITKAKTRDGFVITFRPGAAFFSDYDRFYRNRPQGGLQFEFHDDRRDISEPLKVAYLFIEKRTGQARRDIPYVPSKDVETAKYFLDHLAPEQVGDFLDYALAEAKKTNFDVQTLGGVKQYLSGYIASREHRAAAMTAAADRKKHEQEEADRIAYDQLRRSRADALFATLAPSEQATITGLARPADTSFGTNDGALAKIMFDIARARITAERHGGEIPTFEQWKSTRRVPQG
jgi:Replication initiator protein A